MLNLARCLHEAFFEKKFLPGTKQRQKYYQHLHHDHKRQLYATMRYALAFWLSLQQELPQLAKKKHLELAHCCSFIALERLLSGTAPIYHISAQLKADLGRLRLGWSLSLYLPWLKKYSSFDELFARIQEKDPIKLLLKQYPELSVHDVFGHPPLGVRLHDPNALSELDALTISKKLSDETLILKKNSPEAKALFESGRLSYQNPSAQKFAAILPEITQHFKEPLNILDACAAPGAKTQILLENKQPEDQIICCDLADRLDALEENLERRGAELYQNVSVVGHNWEEGSLTDAEPFHIVLLDGPCSGSGVTRKHPDALWRLCEQQLEEHHDRLLKIAQNCLENLAAGGFLIYATCSLMPQENDQVIQKLIGASNGTLQKQEFSLDHGEATHFGWQLNPDEAHDGLFYAVLRKSL